jgi:hypothetical protein
MGKGSLPTGGSLTFNIPSGLALPDGSGAEMLKESQVLARSALAIGSFIVFRRLVRLAGRPWYTYL